MVLAAIAKAIFGSANDRQVKKYLPRVAAINALEPEFEKLTDDAAEGQDPGVPRTSSRPARSLDDILEPRLRHRA